MNSNKISRYKIYQILGEGATSTVYKAIDMQENKTVAFKVFSSRNSSYPQDAIQNRMKNEYKILRHLKSEHIVKLEEFISPNTLVLEHCDTNLITFLNEHELDFKGIKKIIRMILLGVHEIHSKNIIHRDLKLGNILIKGDCVKICDFGLSCFEDENDFSYCGTKDYLAPEIAAFEKEKREIKYDNKIDIYALGVIYKTLLSRKKNVEIQEVDAGDDIKELIQSMVSLRPEDRPTAYQILCHPSFDELFANVVDFRLLKSYMKITKYGIVTRNSKNQTEECIGISYGDDLNKNKLEIVSYNQDTFSHLTILNGKVLDIKLASNSVLKYFNYLVSYFKIICDKTIQSEIKDGNYKYYRTVSNISVIECNKFKVVKKGKQFEVTYFSSYENTSNQRMQFDSKTVPKSIDLLFKNFEERDLANKNLISIENNTYRNTISLMPESLFKKYQFYNDIGWCIKENFGFIILLNEGNKIDIFIEECCISMNNSNKVNINEVDTKILETIRILLMKFV